MSKFRDYDKYEVYEDGRIWSYKTKRFLKPILDKSGYQMVQLSDNEGKIKRYLLHRVIYEAVTGNPIQKGMQINHIDERKDNNSRSNLEILTPKENINWGTRTERYVKSRSKQVGAFKDEKLIMTFTSTQEAVRNGFDSGHISKCCNGKLKTHKGYTWKYL